MFQEPSTAVQYPVHQPEDIIITDHSSQGVVEDLVVDGREVLNNIHSQNKTVASRKLLKPIHRAMGAFSNPVCIAVENKAALEPGFYHITKGMMNDPVSERGSTDQPHLGLMYSEVDVGTWLIATSPQLILQLEHMICELMLESGGSFSSPFTEGCPVMRIEQILP